MATALTIIWFATAIGGAVAAVLALLMRDSRQPLFLASTAAFAVAGVLGIFSIGIIFLMLAGMTGVAAARAGPEPVGRA